MRAPVRRERIFNYTLMPTRMRGFFPSKELAQAELHDGFPFSKGCRLLKVPAGETNPEDQNQPTRLFDLKNDPGQEHPLHDPVVEERMLTLLRDLLLANQVPDEVFEARGIS